MALNSEYFPKIYDGMLKHNGQVDDKIDKIKNKIDDLIDKENRKYIVNHDPQIELPFEEKYAYIRDKVDKIRCGESLDKNRRLELFTHIFISGYLPNGATIHFDDSDTPGYSELYINGVPYTSDYTCRTTEGGAWEKINILAVQTEADPLNGVKGVLRVHYKDMPLKFFKVVLYDDVATQIFPIIDELFISQEIDTLICYGDYRWTYTNPSTLRVWKGNKGIVWRASAYLGNLQEFIFPNVAFMPNLNYLSSDKSNLRKIDISNCRGAVAYLQAAQLSNDLVLQCSRIGDGAFYGADIKSIDTGAYCTGIDGKAFRGSKIQSAIIGASVSTFWEEVFRECKFLERVTFKNANPVSLSGGSGLIFYNCVSLQDINFSYIQSIQTNTFEQCTVLANLTFIDKSISCNLYFGASSVITEQSCLNIINAIADNAKIKVQLHSTVKTQMTNTWYCKLSGGKYVSCTAEDEGAVTQAAAILARGGTLT